ncbi:MAG: hypothetical protein HY815_14325, partial [Candidatus Riflebacteria bacterium]|nr:hypothetical protein [Candidatus Riflebacteria bacterium]
MESGQRCPRCQTLVSGGHPACPRCGDSPGGPPGPSPLPDADDGAENLVSLLDRASEAGGGSAAPLSTVPVRPAEVSPSSAPTAVDLDSPPPEGPASPGTPLDPAIAPAGSGDGAALFAGRYRIDRLLGRGGMGIVYLARDLRLERDVALKLLWRADDWLVSRFAVEAKMLAGLEHEHVVRVYDFGSAGPTGIPPAAAAPGGSSAYLVMEYVRGKPLSVRLSEGRPTLAESAR